MRSPLLGAVLVGSLAAGCLVHVEAVADPSAAFVEARQLASRATGRHGRARTLHVLAYDPEDGELTRLSLPTWLARRLDPEDLDLDGAAGRLRLDDVRKAAPGFLLESEDEDGERVLVWLD
jgi:hypothetical protein